MLALLLQADPRICGLQDITTSFSHHPDCLRARLKFKELTEEPSSEQSLRDEGSAEREQGVGLGPRRTW